VLSLYSLCKEFNILPNAGGLYEQSPEVVFYFSVIAGEVNKVESEKAKEMERKNKFSGRGIRHR